MSKHYNRIKGYYDAGLWPIQWVRDAVAKQWITAGEYQQITGEDYNQTAAPTETA